MVEFEARWDDEENCYKYFVAVNRTPLGEFFHEEAAYDAVFRHLGYELKVSYD